MRGLIIKDLYCLKRHLITFALIIAGTVSVAIMFVLSEQYGNLGQAVSGMADAGFDIASVVKTAVMFFMILPIVCTGDIAESFAYDKAASFYKIEASLPVSTAKRVLSKYVTAMLFLSAGLAVDVAMAAVISSVSDIIVFSKCMGVLVSIAACMLVYTSCVITLSYAGVSSLYSSFLPLVAAGIIIIAVKAKEMINAFTHDDFSSVARSFASVLNAMESRPYVFALAAFAVAAVCCFISIRFAGRKRGVV